MSYLVLERPIVMVPTFPGSTASSTKWEKEISAAASYEEIYMYKYLGANVSRVHVVSSQTMVPLDVRDSSDCTGTACKAALTMVRGWKWNYPGSSLQGSKAASLLKAVNSALCNKRSQNNTPLAYSIVSSHEPATRRTHSQKEKLLDGGCDMLLTGKKKECFCNGILITACPCVCIRQWKMLNQRCKGGKNICTATWKKSWVTINN